LELAPEDYDPAVVLCAGKKHLARQLARSAVAMYLDVVGELDPTSQQPSGGVISDEVLDRFAMAGTPEQVAERAEALFEAGARSRRVRIPSRPDRGGGDPIARRAGPDPLALRLLPV
jgi:alkanesulfonate monooxygenase SsuD/methylene tetrahydromethanopterin reductase-like flavin-dependent oxidoreductase (luciferase family)